MINYNKLKINTVFKDDNKIVVLKNCLFTNLNLCIFFFVQILITEHVHRAQDDQFAF